MVLFIIFFLIYWKELEMFQNLKSFIGIALQAICIAGCIVLLGTAFAAYSTVRTRSTPTGTKQTLRFDPFNITEVSGKDMNVKNADDTESDVWIVLLTVDNEHLPFFQYWFWNFERLEIQVPVIAIAEDDASFKTLTELYTDKKLFIVIRSDKDNADSLVFERSPAFNRLLRERHSHIVEQLKLGRNVLFCDVDSVWLQDPFPYFTGDFDIWAQLDGCQIREGFIAIKSNDKTIDFISKWEYYLVVQHVTGDEADIRVVSENKHEWDLRLKTLDSDKFPTVDQYFNLDDEQRSNAVVVQNNDIPDHEGNVETLKKLQL